MAAVVAPPGEDCELEWVHMPMHIRFGTQESRIDPLDMPLIEEAAASLSSRPDIRRVRIEGHSMRCGGEPDGDALSLRRAEAVRDALRARGRDLPELEVVGYGDRYPVRPQYGCDPEGQRAFARDTGLELLIQRRVELTLQICRPRR